MCIYHNRDAIDGHLVNVLASCSPIALLMLALDLYKGICQPIPRGLRGAVSFVWTNNGSSVSFAGDRSRVILGFICIHVEQCFHHRVVPSIHKLDI